MPALRHELWGHQAYFSHPLVNPWHVLQITRPKVGSDVATICKLSDSESHSAPLWVNSCLIASFTQTTARRQELQIGKTSCVCHGVQVGICQLVCLCNSNPATLWSLILQPHPIAAPPPPESPPNAPTIRSFVRPLSQHLQENLSQFSPLLLICSPSRLPLWPHWDAGPAPSSFCLCQEAPGRCHPTMHCARAKSLCQFTPL